MPSRPTQGLIALNADGNRVDDARRRLLADWCRLVGSRVNGDDPEPAVSADAPCVAPRVTPAGPVATNNHELGAIDPPLTRTAMSVSHQPLASDSPVAPALPMAVADLGLPPRMSQVLVGLLAGAAEKQIARELSLSPHTVHAYVKQIYKRLSVSSRGELFARFLTLR